MANEFTVGGRQIQSGRSLFRPRLSVSLRRLDRPSGRARAIPERAPRHRGGDRGAGSRHGRGLRADEAGPKPVIYEAARIGGRLRSQPFEGRRGRHRRAGRHAFPGLVDRLLPLPRPGRAGDRPFPNPLTPAAQHGRRPRRQDDYVEQPGHCRRCSTRWRRPGPRRWRRVRVHRDPGRDPSPRRGGLKALWNKLVPIWDDRTFYDFVATSRRLLEAVLPPPRGVRPGRLRYRRLGFRLPELDAGDPARRDDQLRRGPAPGRRRRRAAAAAAVGAGGRAMAHWPAGTTLGRCTPAAPGPASRASPAPATGSRSPTAGA